MSWNNCNFYYFNYNRSDDSPNSDTKSSKNETNNNKEVSDSLNSEERVFEGKLKTKWYYETKETKMGNSQKFAQIISDDVLNFDFPYDGGSKSIFTIRKEKGQTDIYYEISKGQIVSVNPVDGGTIRVKFDDEKPMIIGVSGASDYSSDIIFLNSTSKIISKLKTSKKMIIEVEFYNEGSRQIQFDVEGFEW